MKDTVVQATMGVDDLREALSWSQKKLVAEQSELATVRRRRELAAGINDAETLAVAERFEKQHAERAEVLEQKVAAQARELELAERELGEMKAELRGAMAGAPGSTAAPVDELEDPLEHESAAKVKSELDALARARARADRDADAQRRLDELKKHMGK